MVTRTGGVGSSSSVYDYSGFIPDLIAALSKRLRFDYELYNVSDAYGQLINNEWTGLIGEVMRRDVRRYSIQSLLSVKSSFFLRYCERLELQQYRCFYSEKCNFVLSQCILHIQQMLTTKATYNSNCRRLYSHSQLMVRS